MKGDHNKGFSLIEVMTVVAIIIIMTGLVFANYGKGNQQATLELQAYAFAQDLRSVQEMAMSAKQISGSVAPGYGIYLVEGGTSYIIYADTYPSPGGNSRYDASDTQLKTVNFENRVYFQSLTPNLLSVNFSPPDPATTLTGAGGAVSQATIVLSTQGLTKSQTVIVNKAGLIYVQ
jgi:prepilin-type N-terminal cleavage/methylation domain-containing protein